MGALFVGVVYVVSLVFHGPDASDRRFLDSFSISMAYVQGKLAALDWNDSNHEAK